MKNHTLWLFGLSGSGKTTLSKYFTELFPEFVSLDGDVLREGLCSDLGFTNEDRDENLRRVAHVCELFNSQGKNVIASFITPLKESRKKIKKIIKRCSLIYVYSPLEVCENRDVKGLYKKAREGTISLFTGISAPFDGCEQADFMIDTSVATISESVEILAEYFVRNV